MPAPSRSNRAVAFGIGPHPHMGLQTVTWLVAGELLHLDSLGSEQLIRPGQLNLMTAGHGVAHAEEDPATGRGGPRRPALGGAAGRHPRRPAGLRASRGAAAPRARPRRGDRPRRRFAGVASPARRDTEHMGVELTLRGPSTVVPLRADYEHALVVLEGRVMVDGVVVEPGVLAYLGLGRDECRVRGGGAGPRPAARRRAVPRAAPHVVELRRAHPRGGLGGQTAVGGRRRPLRPRAVLARAGSRSGRPPGSDSTTPPSRAGSPSR